MITPCFSFFSAFWKKKTIFPPILVDFINHDKCFLPYLCTDIKHKLMKEMTDKQRAARKLASDYSRYLFDQENLVERILERKWQVLSSYIEVTIRGGKPKRSENNKGGGQTPRRLPECALLPCIFVRPKTVLFALKRVVLQSASR
jgi:hypothetical protein